MGEGGGCRECVELPLRRRNWLRGPMTLNKMAASQSSHRLRRNIVRRSWWLAGPRTTSGDWAMLSKQPSRSDSDSAAADWAGRRRANLRRHNKSMLGNSSLPLRCIHYEGFALQCFSLFFFHCSLIFR